VAPAQYKRCLLPRPGVGGRGVLDLQPILRANLGLMTMLMLLALAANIAAQTPPPYPTDVTLTTLEDSTELSRLQQPGVTFHTERFEADDALAEWYNFDASDERPERAEVVLDAGEARSGRGALRLTTADRGGNESGVGPHYWFDPGHDTVYFRRYIRFAEDYDQGNLNHVGGALYAVAGSNRWAQMGKAGLKPDGDDRFGARLEPWRDWGRHTPPGAMMLYTYWMDMKPDRSGPYYGNNLMPTPDRQITLDRGRWYCLEHMIRANTPGAADGEMAAWIDGELYIHLTGFRWRTTAELRLKRMSLDIYVHRSEQVNTVWYDDVALSTGYIGPTGGGAAEEEQ
jgi:hypothetical protein